MVQAKELAEALGESQPDPAWLQSEINRLRKKTIMPLGHVSQLHDWLDGKRKSRQSCQVVGESRTGKSVACESYFYRHKPQQETDRSAGLHSAAAEVWFQGTFQGNYRVLEALGNQGHRVRFSQ